MSYEDACEAADLVNESARPRFYPVNELNVFVVDLTISSPLTDLALSLKRYARDGKRLSGRT